MHPHYLLAPALALSMLIGCSQMQPYVAPPNAPHAQIRSELNALDIKGNWLLLTEASTMACKYGRTVAVRPGKTLFEVSRTISKPSGFITVEAGRPLHWKLHAWMNGNRRCHVDFIGTFNPGSHYVIRGGISDGIDILGGCYMQVIDIDSGQPVMTSPAPVQEYNCALDKLPLLLN